MNRMSERLLESRYSGDAQRLQALRAQPRIAESVRRAAELRHKSSARVGLLADAVRVDLDLLQALASSIEKLRVRAGLEEPIEAFVSQEPKVNASVTRGPEQMFVNLTSGAVNHLSAEELEFVIGHELGHAIFGHLELPAAWLMAHGGLDPRGSMELRAWQRACEISADRAGLVCCESLEVAATALFRMQSGLATPGLRIDPHEFAEQWEHLEQEVIEGHEHPFWKSTHPFLPLRMKAMIVFAESGFPIAGAPGDRTSWAHEKADAEVARLLALMNPLAREGPADPMLADLFLWGGALLALADGKFAQAEIERLSGLVSRDKLMDAVGTVGVKPEALFAEFSGALARRSRKLRALEVHRLLEGLLQVAVADGELGQVEVKTLRRLAAELGISERGCDLVIANFLQETKHVHT